MSDLSAACTGYKTNIARADDGNIEGFLLSFVLIWVHLFVDAKASSGSCTFRRVNLCRRAPISAIRICPRMGSAN